MEELGSRSYKAHKNNIKKPTCGCQTSTKGAHCIPNPHWVLLDWECTCAVYHSTHQSRASLATFSDLSQSQCEVHRADEGDSYAEYSSGEKTKIGINVSMNKVEAWYMLFKKIGNTFIDDGLMMG
ncbi:hypothetical protein ZEAMMB73_Zm00001d037535 [Zea mays]|uniref:Uncharacterized protein n=1 Tax=Zea mays TaxID=4577 RepID=A0A1D6LYL6_MAIZE|nr:hypothetical protein ZEAMMB73_Zm00001d037535 [Zea mays]